MLQKAIPAPSSFFVPVDISVPVIYESPDFDPVDGVVTPNRPDCVS